jgi:hypothetical protein
MRGDKKHNRSTQKAERGWPDKSPNKLGLDEPTLEPKIIFDNQTAETRTLQAREAAKNHGINIERESF